jgi:hypothetical protein
LGGKFPNETNEAVKQMSSYFEHRIAEIRAADVPRREPYAQPAQQIAPPKKQPARKGYVYFFRAGNTVKIGFTTNPRERASKLQTTCPDKAFMAKFVKGTPRTEKAFHDKFAEYRIRGEWFDLRGRLARYIERHFRPVDFPEVIQPEPEPELGEFRF